MAGVNPAANSSVITQMGPATEEESPPALLMTWEDWLTFGAAVLAFLSVAMSLQDAHWVKGAPPLWPTMLAGLLIGMLAARTRMHAAFLHPLALIVGIIVVALMVQTFADGANIVERANDFRIRMRDWFQVVGSGDISNDNLPFVTLVQALCCLSAYMAAWSIYRWRSPWPAIVPGGIVILANISFLEGEPSGWFITFLFGAIVLIARLYLQRRQSRWRHQGIDYPDFLSISAIQLTVLSVGVLIFVAWQLPLGGQTSASEALFGKMVEPITDQSSTFVRLFHNIQAKKGLGLHSFGDYLTVQSDIQLTNKPVAQVTVKGLANDTGAVIRATSYDTYTGAGWKTADRETGNLDARSVAGGNDAVQFQQRAIVSSTIRLLDSTDTLFTVGIPLQANVDTKVDAAKGISFDVERLESRKSLDSGDTYVTQGSVSTATAAQLQSAGNDYPAAIRERYLQLPKELPARVKAAASDIARTGGDTNPYDESAKIAAYLQALPFDLTVPIPPPGQDMVDYFLFDAKKGYFDYNSSAMAVMLRTLGVPARVAVGYLLDPKEQKAGVFTVTRQDTFSWVEVFFPNYGWVTFNPTPASSLTSPGGKPSAGGVNNVDTGVVPPNFLGGAFPNQPEANGKSAVSDKALNQQPTIHGNPPWSLIWALAATALAMLITLILLRIFWNRGLRGLDRRSQLWAKVQRAARHAGIRSRPYETPREFSRRVGFVIDREPEARQLAEAYEEYRYGRPGSPQSDPATAERAYLMLRNKLFGGILRRRALKQRDREMDYRPFG
jgi:transglutaminase-like putative cysteine protease